MRITKSYLKFDLKEMAMPKSGKVGTGDLSLGYVLCGVVGAIAMLLLVVLLAWVKRCQDSVGRGHTR